MLCLLSLLSMSFDFSENGGTCCQCSKKKKTCSKRLFHNHTQVKVKSTLNNKKFLLLTNKTMTHKSFTTLNDIPNVSLITIKSLTATSTVTLNSRETSHEQTAWFSTLLTFLPRCQCPFRPETRQPRPF